MDEVEGQAGPTGWCPGVKDGLSVDLGKRHREGGKKKKKRKGKKKKT